MDLNETLCDVDFKDANPVRTVERIKGILQSHGIETRESWRQTNVPYCHAMGVEVVGTRFSVNGKGLTREFAQASGYGELMERFQLGFIGSPGSQKDGCQSFVRCKYEYVSAKELYSANPEIYNKLAERLNDDIGVKMEPEKMLSQFVDGTGMLPCVPCYNLTKGTKVYFPNEFRLQVYVTNGCAAGNTMEEAIVQAIGEIAERANQNIIISRQLAVPDVPDEELQKYKVAYDIISYIRSKGLRVVIKDCSLGEKFPVICACFIDTKTGKYHTHFGANPVFEIALERALAESFQDANIDNVARFENINTKKNAGYSLSALTNEFTKGTWEKGIDFFIGEPCVDYNPSMGFSGKNNQELLRECVDYFAQKGLEVLVYNSSVLGFPTCQVIIPGCSELFVNRFCREMNEHRYYPYSIKTLRNPSAASISDMLGCLLNLDQTNQIPANINGVHGFLAGSRLSADLTPKEEKRLMSASLGYVYYTLGRYDEVIKCLSAMIPGASGDDLEYLICLKRYLTLKQEKREPDMIRKIITFFHRPATVEQLYGCFERNENPMERFTLHCDLSCTEGCQLYGVCHWNRIAELDEILYSGLEKLDFDAFCAQLQAMLH